MNMEKTMAMKSVLEKRRKTVGNDINDALQNEMDLRKYFYQQDKYYLEKLAIREICGDFILQKKPSYRVETAYYLEDTSLTGEAFINVDQFIKIMNDIGISARLEKDSALSPLKFSLAVNILRSSYKRDYLDLSDESLEKLIEEKKSLPLVLGAYLNYRVSAEAREEAETQLAIEYYDQLTNQWRDNLRFVPNDQFTELGPLTIKNELSKDFGDFDNVLLKLNHLLLETDFEMHVIKCFEGTESETVKIVIREKVHVWDQDPGVAISLFLTNNKKKTD